jgi:hypothetical protein
LFKQTAVSDHNQAHGLRLLRQQDAEIGPNAGGLAGSDCDGRFEF